MAALATAGAILTIRRGSKGLGNEVFRTEGQLAGIGHGHLVGDSASASSAMARTLASFISSVMRVAQTSRAPRKMKGSRGRY